MGSIVAGQTTLRSLGAMTDRPEGRLDRVGSPDALPVLRRKVVERHQLLTVLLQAQCSLRVFRLIRPDEQIKRLLGIHPGSGLPDIMQ